MFLSQSPKNPFLGGPRPRDVDYRSPHEVAQIEAPAESVGASPEVACSVLAMHQRVESAGQSYFEVAQHGVDSLGVCNINKPYQILFCHNRNLVREAFVAALSARVTCDADKPFNHRWTAFEEWVRQVLDGSSTSNE